MELKTIFDTQLTQGSDKWEPYFQVYEKYFGKFVGKSPTLIEIGVQGGGSLEMWKRYFGDGSTIIGIDNDPKVLENKVDGVEIYIGDQLDINLWKKIFDIYPEVDMIIDDGGHYMDEQIQTLQMTFSKLKLGGVYMCEDTHTSYYPYYGGTAKDINSKTFINFSKKLIDFIHRNHNEFAFPFEWFNIFKDLYSVNYYNSQLVLEKESIDFRRVRANKEKLESFLGMKI